MMRPNYENCQTMERIDQLLARVRQRQLELALEGRVLESANYAQRAQRVRQSLDACPPVRATTTN